MSLTTEFLTQLRTLVRHQNGDQLRAWLQVLPSSPQQYHNLANELRTQFPKPRAKSIGRNDDGDAKLEDVVEKGLPEEDDVPEGMATAWPGLVTFVKDYLLFWRDVDYADLVGAHVLLCGLVNSCSTAFAHPTYGGMLLKTSMSLSEALSQLTMMLNKRPDLTSRRRGGGDEDSRKSVAETSAEIIQKIFTTCLTDRSSTRYSKPEGKKVGVYMFANLVLKLLFACRKAHLGKQIFTNISTNSPPLSLYPAAQRVTFLYYLGRFNLSNNHYHRAAAALERAYLETPPSLLSHRTLILSYLIPANLLLGLLPSQTLLQRPEAVGLVPIFTPITQSIRTGNFILFQKALATHQRWLFEKGVLLVLSNRLRPLLWRALARRVFLITYNPTDNNDPSSRKAALLDLHHLHTAATYLQHKMEGYLPAPALPSFPSFPSSHHNPRAKPGISPILLKAVRNSVEANENPTTTTTTTTTSGPSTLVPPPGGPRKLRPNEGMIWGNAEVTFHDVEMAVLNLVDQGLMHGYLAHGPGKFAIMGAKTKGAVVAGWPVVSQAIRARTYGEGEVVDWDDIPGWVKG